MRQEEMYMKFFEEPIVEVQKFNVEDVITTSNECIAYNENETDEDRD